MANPQIGTCPCPMKGCEEVMAVRNSPRAPTTRSRQRKAGKLYADCPVHGRIGGDGSQAMQDYLLDKGDLWNDEELAAHHEAARVAELERKRAQIRRQPPAPAARPPANKAPASAPPKLGGEELQRTLVNEMTGKNEVPVDLHAADHRASRGDCKGVTNKPTRRRLWRDRFQ